MFQSNWQSLAAFMACGTQWNVVGTFASLVWIGLNYVAVDIVLRRHGYPDSVFADLQVMEKEAIATFVEVGE
ncbi:DUF1799 domain-containing protein [Rhizobium lusitanum]|uniref:DUF1799 domain-containing protein n=1 Tax=Rhizobium lusitanum TaxID=293958 RepID=UPI0025737826|nr:DUF1799 domain-containing protein [Rhizobium lusitanum]